VTSITVSYTLSPPEYTFLTKHNWVFALPNKEKCSSLLYRLDDRGSKFRFPAGAGDFSLHHRIQNGSGAHLASYPMDIEGSFLGGKEAGA
jgi:hypothetical protein